MPSLAPVFNDSGVASLVEGAESYVCRPWSETRVETVWLRSMAIVSQNNSVAVELKRHALVG